MDAFPVASQAKSLIQWAAGDSKGAKQTQENFSKQCIVVSQVRSAVEAAKGDKEAARDTQKQFLSMVDGTVSAVPVVGHVKGAIHYATGNKEKGHAAMKASSRSTGVMIGGAAGFIAGGPVGAVAGGVTGGVAMDGIITGADSAKHKEFRPYGDFELVKDPKNPGKWCDVVGGKVIDGVVGSSAGAAASQIQPVVKARIDFQPSPGSAPPSWKVHTASCVTNAIVPGDATNAVLCTVSATDEDVVNNNANQNKETINKAINPTDYKHENEIEECQSKNSKSSDKHKKNGGVKKKIAKILRKKSDSDDENMKKENLLTVKDENSSHLNENEIIENSSNTKTIETHEKNSVFYI